MGLVCDCWVAKPPPFRPTGIPRSVVGPLGSAGSRPLTLREGGVCCCGSYVGQGAFWLLSGSTTRVTPSISTTFTVVPALTLVLLGVRAVHISPAAYTSPIGSSAVVTGTEVPTSKLDVPVGR